MCIVFNTLKPLTVPKGAQNTVQVRDHSDVQVQLMRVSLCGFEAASFSTGPLETTERAPYHRVACGVKC